MAYDQTVYKPMGRVMEPWAWVLVGAAVGAVAVLAVTRPKALLALPGALVALPVALPMLVLMLAVMGPVASLLAVILIPVMGLVVAITVVSIIVAVLAMPIHATVKRVAGRRTGS